MWWQHRESLRCHIINKYTASSLLFREGLGFDWGRGSWSSTHQKGTIIGVMGISLSILSFSDNHRQLRCGVVESNQIKAGACPGPACSSFNDRSVVKSRCALLVQSKNCRCHRCRLLFLSAPQETENGISSPHSSTARGPISGGCHLTTDISRSSCFSPAPRQQYQFKAKRGIQKVMSWILLCYIIMVHIHQPPCAGVECNLSSFHANSPGTSFSLQKWVIVKAREVES